jgi:hypothetical protein
MIRVLLFVDEAAQEAHREAAFALGQALVRHDRLQARLQQLLRHLGLQL